MRGNPPPLAGRADEAHGDWDGSPDQLGGLLAEWSAEVGCFWVFGSGDLPFFLFFCWTVPRMLKQTQGTKPKGKVMGKEGFVVALAWLITQTPPDAPVRSWQWFQKAPMISYLQTVRPGKDLDQLAAIVISNSVAAQIPPGTSIFPVYSKGVIDSESDRWGAVEEENQHERIIWEFEQHIPVFDAVLPRRGFKLRDGLQNHSLHTCSRLFGWHFLCPCSCLLSMTSNWDIQHLVRFLQVWRPVHLCELFS